LGISRKPENMSNTDVWGMLKKYAPEVERIILENTKHFLHIRLATEEEDTKQSTDLVGEIKVKFAIRVRETTFRDFTIRARSKYGGKTEIDKIRSGEAECDYYFYFWGNKQEKISDWILVDMRLFKSSGLANKDEIEKEIMGEKWNEKRDIISNTDGTGFLPYSINELRESGCLIDGTL
jgi:hypothetical protein